MNVFVLTTGRSGSTTFIKACDHINNYTAGHETRNSLLGSERMQYPSNHIEADNRLAWFLGQLDQSYGQKAFYVHLRRDSELVAASFERRSGSGIMKAYMNHIIRSNKSQQSHSLKDYADDYVLTVNLNIELFLRDKPLKMEFSIARPHIDFPIFWDRVSAQGDLDQAIKEFETFYNKGKKNQNRSTS
jgi:hypothetical protein